MTRVLLFSDISAALRFIRRHRDRVIHVIVLVDEDLDNAGWKGAIRKHYGALVLSGLILLQES